MPNPPPSTRIPAGCRAAVTLLLLLGFGDLTLAVDSAAGDPPRLRERFAELAVSDELPSGLSLTAFEQLLEARYFGTYVFYQSLEASDRDTVYQSYRRDPHIASIRTATLERLR